MDARIPPLALFGLELGDAQVLRNAGGRVTLDVIRSLVLSNWALGTRRIVVVHHTDCALQEASPGMAGERVRAAGGPGYVPMAMHGFADLATSVAEDVRAIRSERLLPTDLEVEGYVLDVATGALEPVPASVQRTGSPMPPPPATR